MNILVAGGTGFIGTAITRYLAEQGHSITILGRSKSKSALQPPKTSVILSDIRKPGKWQDLIGDQETIINLTGISIFRIWTKQSKKAILESRIRSTQNLVQALQNRKCKCCSLLSISGVGYYGYHGDELIDETNGEGHDFLAQVAARWESVAKQGLSSGIRVVLCRLGHVLGKNGGILPKLATLSRLRLGSHWGNGMQWISWLHIYDLCRAFDYLINNPHLEGAVNITSPEPVRNKEFMKILNSCTRSKSILSHIPGWTLKSITGEFATVFLNGQRVIPERLAKQGFSFQYQNLTDAMKDIFHCDTI